MHEQQITPPLEIPHTSKESKHLGEVGSGMCGQKMPSKHAFLESQLQYVFRNTNKSVQIAYLVFKRQTSLQLDPQTQPCILKKKDVIFLFKHYPSIIFLPKELVACGHIAQPSVIQFYKHVRDSWPWFSVYLALKIASCCLI